MLEKTLTKTGAPVYNIHLNDQITLGSEADSRIALDGLEGKAKLGKVYIGKHLNVWTAKKDEYDNPIINENGYYVGSLQKDNVESLGLATHAAKCRQVRVPHQAPSFSSLAQLLPHLAFI